jgi:hypothetical protein
MFHRLMVDTLEAQPCHRNLTQDATITFHLVQSIPFPFCNLEVQDVITDSTDPGFAFFPNFKSSIMYFIMWLCSIFFWSFMVTSVWGYHHLTKSTFWRMNWWSNTKTCKWTTVGLSANIQVYGRIHAQYTGMNKAVLLQEWGTTGGGENMPTWFLPLKFQSCRPSPKFLTTCWSLYL